MSSEQKEEFDSELGKLSHWEAAYELEIANYLDHGDVGEIW